MKSEVIVSKLEELEKKLKKLIQDHENVKEELLAAKTENEELKALVSSQTEEIKNFQNQDKISKIVSSIADTQDHTELKLKINEYIKEIDRCIVYLSE
jgi:septal ring factor EnvC (AmiA/AmiB activator)